MTAIPVRLALGVGGVGCGQCWEDAIRGDELVGRVVERAGGEAA